MSPIIIINKRRHLKKKIENFIETMYKYADMYPEVTSLDVYNTDVKTTVEILNKLKERIDMGDDLQPIEARFQAIVNAWRAKYTDPPQLWRIRALDKIQKLKNNLPQIDSSEIDDIIDRTFSEE